MTITLTNLDMENLLRFLQMLRQKVSLDDADKATLRSIYDKLVTDAQQPTAEQITTWRTKAEALDEIRTLLRTVV